MKQEADSRDGDDAKRNERFVIFKEEDEDGREMVTEEEEGSVVVKTLWEKGAGNLCVH